MNLFTEVSSFFSKKNLIKNSKKIFFFLAASSIFFVAFKIKKNIELKKNQRALSEVFEIFERYESLIKESSFFPLDELLFDIDKAYEANKNSKFSDYFLACKSSILAFQGKIEDSKEILKKTNFFDKDKDFTKSMYKFSFALFLKNNSDKKEDLDFAEKILNDSLNTKNQILKEAFIFYNGLNEFYTKDIISADKAWEVFFNDPKYTDSPYRILIEKVRNWEY